MEAWSHFSQISGVRAGVGGGGQAGSLCKEKRAGTFNLTPCYTPRAVKNQNCIHMPHTHMHTFTHTESTCQVQTLGHHNLEAFPWTHQDHTSPQFGNQTVKPSSQKARAGEAAQVSWVPTGPGCRSGVISGPPWLPRNNSEANSGRSFRFAAGLHTLPTGTCMSPASEGPAESRFFFSNPLRSRL